MSSEVCAPYQHRKWRIYRSLCTYVFSIASKLQRQYYRSDLAIPPTQPKYRWVFIGWLAVKRHVEIWLGATSNWRIGCNKVSRQTAKLMAVIELEKSRLKLKHAKIFASEIYSWVHGLKIVFIAHVETSLYRFVTRS